MKRKGAKERIIEAASHLFYFEGYNQTGINQILKESGASKDSMYRHFKSKEDIAVTYLKDRHLLWVGNLLSYIKSETSNKEKLITSFDYLKDWLVDVEFRGCGFQNIISDLPKDQQKIKDQVVIHKNELRGLIHDLLKDDELYATSEAEQLGDEILVLMEGAIILSQIQQNSWPIISAKRTCIKLLL
jgi:AcrR family transcriptional regulator